MQPILVMCYFVHISCDSKEIAERLLKTCCSVVKYVIQYIVRVLLVREEYFTYMLQINENVWDTDNSRSLLHNACKEMILATFSSLRLCNTKSYL